MTDGIRIFGTGPSGCGKSTVMNQIIATASHLIVFDYLPTRRVTAAGMGLIEFDTLKGVSDHVAATYLNGGFRIWYRPPPENQTEALHGLSRYLLDLQAEVDPQGVNVAPITLAVDEMSEGFPVEKLPNDQRGFYRICKAGRHYRITVIGMTQRPAQVNTEFRGNAEMRYIFRTTEPVDVKAIEETGGKGTPFGRELARKAQQLPKYHYLLMRYDEDREMMVVDNGVTAP